MDDKNITILQPDDLIAEIKSQSEAITGSMNNQLTTLQLLDGTLLMSFGMQSQLFAGMLGELALQSSFSSAQLGEQQLYDAAALEGAAAMYLLVNTLSGNVKGIVDSLVGLGGLGQAISENVGKYLPMIEKMEGGASNGLGTAFAGISAVTGVIAIAGGIGAILPILGAILPALAVFATAIGIFAVIAGGASAWVDHTYSDIKSQPTSKSGNNSQFPTIPQIQSQEQAQSCAQALPETQDSLIGTTQTIDPVQAAVDPFNTGEGDQSRYNQYQSQIDSSRANADTLREAVKTGNAEVAAQIGALTDAIHRLADKPADRKVNSEITIQSLRTHATLSEFRDMLNEVLKMEEQVSA